MGIIDQIGTQLKFRNTQLKKNSGYLPNILKSLSVAPVLNITKHENKQQSYFSNYLLVNDFHFVLKLLEMITSSSHVFFTEKLKETDLKT